MYVGIWFGKENIAICFNGEGIKTFTVDKFYSEIIPASAKYICFAGASEEVQKFKASSCSFSEREIKKFVTGKATIARDMMVMETYKKWKIDTETDSEAYSVVLSFMAQEKSMEKFVNFGNLSE